MPEKTKSATTAPKPRKTAAKKKAADNHSNVTEITVTREVPRDEIARLAHQLWNDRGRQHGHDAEDWFQAEHALRGKAS